MREQRLEHLESRDATPQLTVAKHQLRDWIESKLAGLGERGDEAALVRELNAALSKEKLLCFFSTAGSPLCPDESWVGFLNEIRGRREGNNLIIETAVGIQCGFDESAYIYEWTDGHWQRRWESEQNDYAKDRYKPQYLSAVHISLPDAKKSQMVLTLGRESWCASNWHDVYYRLWRVGPQDESPKLLLEGSDEWAFVEHPIQGTVEPDDALIEYSTMSVDKGVLLRQTVHHYRIDGDKVERTAPQALSPRDFADEWLSRPWSSSVSWSEPAARAPLQQWHRRLHSDSPNGEFEDPSLHCPKNPDLWQVGIDLDPASGKGKRVATYFLVRWRPPYRFSLVNISNRPFLGCTEKDPDADASRTLFPGQ